MKFPTKLHANVSQVSRLEQHLTDGVIAEERKLIWKRGNVPDGKFVGM